MTENAILPKGHSPVPAGKIACVETHLQMMARPPRRAVQDNGLRFDRWEDPALSDYRTLFRDIGQEWLWTSRLVMSDEKLAAILSDPEIHIYRLMDGERGCGLVELDFRQEGECELVFFGLAADAIGKGAGRFMMEGAIDRAWVRPIKRFWVHTCTNDSQAALPFYCRSGFTPFAVKIEVDDDPRLTGLFPRDTAPHVPIVEA